MSVIIPGSNLAQKLSYTQNIEIHELGPTLTATGTVTGSKAWGSSLFLHRMFLPSAIALTEVDLALGISFAATNEGAGTLSQSFMIYSFANSTSLATVATASSAFAWATGTVTVAGSSYTQLQGGWTGPNIHPMTFASTLITGGEYVIGNLLNFAQGSSTWTVSLYGDAANLFQSTTTTIFAVTSVATATATAFSNAGTAALADLSNAGTAAMTVGTGTIAVSSYGAAFLAGSTSGSTAGVTSAMLRDVSIAGGSTGTAVASLSASGTAKSTGDWSMIWLSSNSNMVSSVSMKSSAITALTSPTANNFTAWTVAPTFVSAITGLTNNSATTTLTVGTSSFPSFGYIGSASSNSTSTYPTQFVRGIYSTGASLANISLGTANTSLSYSGSYVLQQPWFALGGA